ncbi:MAG: RNA polymerase subunit sigma [Bacteroidetes bacterium]|nr:MAG: RNA polymerase subunit sigma [Bacteroidota bacterium]
MDDKIKLAAQLIQNSKHTTAFTGAGVSVESGIPPFRGENGLWSKYDPIVLDIDYFHSHPKESWIKIKEIFYDFFGQAKPNAAHYSLANLENNGLLKSVITQNIDNLHQEAGSKTIYEFHGNSQKLICTKCNKIFDVKEINLDNLPPKCSDCGGVLKPDFVFFGEQIPEYANTMSQNEAQNAEVFLVIGTTGEIMPASIIPHTAKQNGAKIIEINTQPSNYTNSITDIFLQGKATEIMKKIELAVN